MILVTRKEFLKTPCRWGDTYGCYFRDVYELIDWAICGYHDHPGTHTKTMFPAQELSDKWIDFLRSKGYMILTGG